MELQGNIGTKVEKDYMFIFYLLNKMITNWMIRRFKIILYNSTFLKTTGTNTHIKYDMKQ